MKKRVLLIGGYGNFGKYIVQELAKDDDLQLIIAGRSLQKSKSMAKNYSGTEYDELDIHGDLQSHFQKTRPDIVINTCGPYQNQDYRVARACIDYGCDYIDLADAREFVVDFDQLSEDARKKNLTLITGASSVPCLSSAIIDHYLPSFQEITELDYGIATAHLTNTGLATVKGVMGYVGKKFYTIVNSRKKAVYGWQNTTLRHYPDIGYKFLGNCDIADLTLFPNRYPSLKTIRFRAGLEISALHLGLWGLSWLVRLGILRFLESWAENLLKCSRWFDVIGGNKSGFHMELSGVAKNGKPLALEFILIAKSGHGPFIPTFPAILCTRMIARGQIAQRGAFPCIGIVSYEQYMDALKHLDIKRITHERKL